MDTDFLESDFDIDADVSDPDAPVETIAEALSGVWDRIHRRIEDHLRPAEVVTTRLVEGPVDQSAINVALASLLDLATWLGELGMISAARLTRHLFERLSNPDHLRHADSAAAVTAAGLLEDLRSSVATTAGGGRSGALGDNLLVIGDPGQAADSLVWFAVTSGFTVNHSTRLRSWPRVADAIVVVGDDQRSTAATIMATRLAAERYPGVPIVVGAPEDPLERVEMARYATSLLALQARPVEIVEEVRRQIHVRRRTERVVVHGEGCDEVIAVLGARGVQAWDADDLSELIAGLEAGRASGVVLMPSSDNARLVSVIRAQVSTRRCIVAEVVPEHGPMVPRIGVDLTVPADAAGETLARSLPPLFRLRADVDADLAASTRNGGVPWASATFLAERLLLGVHRSDSVASLCVVQFDETDSVSQVDAVQEQLLREFRTDDIVTRSGDRETILVLGGVDHEVSSARLEAMASRLVSVGIRAGVAEFPYDAQSVGDLVEVARGLLDRSRTQGGPRVVTADWRPGGLVAHDVLVADSDPAIARVISEALERTGLSVDHVNDGQVLLDRLQDPLVRLPKVVLLEFDLLSIDGLTILRRLQKQAALRRFDVVMLSARTRENDIREAYDLGAVDVIQKPFAPGILVRRLLRIMDADG